MGYPKEFLRIKLEVKPHSFASYIFHVLFPNASFINPVGLEVRQGTPTLFSLFLFSNNSVLRRDLTWHTKDRIIRSLMLPKTSLICLIILECLSQQDRLVLYVVWQHQNPCAVLPYESKTTQKNPCPHKAGNAF